MKYLKIQNDGVLDIRLVALMGGTTKANDKFKIGQFGTGLKYTLAYLYRNNLDFKIYAGTEEIKLHTEIERIKEQDFEIICINGQRTSITTQMGAEWEAWMIIRELWCNALDEGGHYKAISEKFEGVEDKTTFYIQITAEIQKVIDNWGKYFRHESTPIFENELYALYPPGEHLCIYKQGVLIKEMTELKSVFGYDMKDAAINELRELRYSPSMVVTYCIANANEKAIQYFLENVTENHYEGGNTIDYNWYQTFGEQWKTVIGNAKIISHSSLQTLKDRGINPDESTLIKVPKVLYRHLSKEFPGIGAVSVAGTLSNFYEHYDELLESKIKQALTILESCDYPMHPELSFVYGWFEDKTVLAQINLKEKKIFVSSQLIQKPLFTVISMLIEENEHFNTGLTDCSRSFQQHFIDLYTRTLLAKNEIEI